MWLVLNPATGLSDKIPLGKRGDVPVRIAPFLVLKGQFLTDTLQGIIDSSPDTSMADKVEDALDKLRDAFAELSKNPPNGQGALGNLEGVVGELEAAVNEGLYPLVGAALMGNATGMARVLAEQATAEAMARGGDAEKIDDARWALADGDALRASESFKDAVAKYKDALANAEGA